MLRIVGSCVVLRARRTLLGLLHSGGNLAGMKPRHQTFTPGGPPVAAPDGQTPPAAAPPTPRSSVEGITPPGAGAPRHIHHSCDELFYILEGESLFLVGERQGRAQPATLVFIPPGNGSRCQGYRD